MTFDDIQILQQRFLRGPNFWTYRSAVEAWLDIGELEKFPSNTIPGFVDRLIDWLFDFDRLIGLFDRLIDLMDFDRLIEFDRLMVGGLVD